MLPQDCIVPTLMPNVEIWPKYNLVATMAQYCTISSTNCEIQPNFSVEATLVLHCINVDTQHYNPTKIQFLNNVHALGAWQFELDILSKHICNIYKHFYRNTLTPTNLSNITNHVGSGVEDKFSHKSPQQIHTSLNVNSIAVAHSNIIDFFIIYVI